VKCQFVFLAVGNADSIIIIPENSPAIVVDMPQPGAVRKWLENEAVDRVGAIYFTHGHRDHLAALETLAAFLEDWLKKHDNAFITLYLPTDATRKTIKQIRQEAPTNAIERSRDALARIEGWQKQNRMIVKRPERDNIPHQYANLSVDVLHPSYLFSERHSAQYPLKANETSLVVRARFGNFAALLLADIEGRGVTELLENSKDSDVQANLVKIPHHGAGPGEGAALKELLGAVGAELAVLSVGSKNRYGHVAPELFKLLLSLQESNALGRFVCTEVTRTCVYSIGQRQSAGTSGLSERKVCAGNVVIRADDSGEWEMLFLAEHQETIRQIERAACDHRADL